MAKERYQNPVVGDTLNLRLHVFNYHSPADVLSVKQVDVYFLDPDNRCEENPDGRRLVESFDGSLATTDNTGEYLLPVTLTGPKYVIGQYFDVWTAEFTEGEIHKTNPHPFQVYPDLWYTTPIPVIYDFNFHFQPNKLRKGSKQYIQIEVIPNVPKAKDIQQYYENLAIVADLKISIEQTPCSNCVPQENDLRLVVDEEPVDYREKRWGYYKLDTADLDCGIYNVWFRLDFGDNVYLSDKMQLLIFE
jgi:hypothetical protein